MKSDRWKRIRRWLTKSWRWILWALAAIVGVVVVTRGARAIRDRVMRRRMYRPVPGKPGMLQIQSDGDWVEVKLPPGVMADEVTAAGLSERGEWTVEVLHEKTDRRGDPDRGRDSKLDL